MFLPQQLICLFQSFFFLCKKPGAGRYGRNLAIWINYTINIIPESQKEKYKSVFLDELKKYSFEPRKKGEPKTSGCIQELSDIIDMDIKNPEELAKLVKEGIHLMY